MGLSTLAKAVTTATRVGGWLLVPGGSNRYITSLLTSMRPFWNTRVAAAESAADPQSPADHLLSITLTKMGPVEESVVCSASFATNEFSALAVLKFSSRQRHTSPLLLRWRPSTGK